MTRDLYEFAVRIAVQQALRKARRSVAAFVGITGGILLVLVQLGFQSALYESSVRLHHILKGDLIMAPVEFRSLVNAPWFRYDHLLAALANPAVASVAPLYIGQVPMRNVDNRYRDVIMGIGIDLNNPAVDLTAVGADIRDLAIPGNVLFDARSQPAFGDVMAKFRPTGRTDLEIAYNGDVLQRKVTVIGTYALGGSIVFTGSMLASLDTLAGLSREPIDRLTIGTISLKPGADPEQVRADLATTLSPDVKIFTKAAFVDYEIFYWKTEKPIGFLFDMGAIIGFLISAIYTYQVLYQIVDENLPQYALLKSMGYPRGFFIVLVIATAAILTLTAMPAAVLAGYIVYAICAKATMLDVQLTVLRVVSVAAVMQVLSLVSALIAIRRLNRADPATLL
jgi:putative ABC transport system permease protein